LGTIAGSYSAPPFFRITGGVMTIRKLIGSRIQQLRKKARMTQEEVAELSNITAKHLGSIEGGKENPTIETLLGIANALNVDLRELLNYERRELSRKEMSARIINAIKTAKDDDLRLIVRFVEMLSK
jgi:transcriptional regulator with XRE-family HTH domain